jgi:hypothetical protein
MKKSTKRAVVEKKVHALFAQKLAILYEVTLREHGDNPADPVTWAKRTRAEKAAWLAVVDSMQPFSKMETLAIALRGGHAVQY